MIYYYFLKVVKNGYIFKDPIITYSYLGNIEDRIEYNGMICIIVDYAEERIK